MQLIDSIISDAISGINYQHTELADEHFGLVKERDALNFEIERIESVLNKHETVLKHLKQLDEMGRTAQNEIKQMKVINDIAPVNEPIVDMPPGNYKHIR